MTDGVWESKLGPTNPAEYRADPPCSFAQTEGGPSPKYLKIVENAKKVVAVAFGICGLGLVVCANRHDYLHETLRRSSGMWERGITIFAGGVCTCLVVTLALIFEYLARPSGQRPFSYRSLVARAVVILCASAAVLIWFQTSYGIGQGLGALLSTFLLLAAAQEKNRARKVLVVLALIAICLTFVGTHTSYQYAVRHADEIVAAANDLAKQCPTEGEIQLVDSRVPSVLRYLGARRIWVDQKRVNVYVGGNIEYEIYLQPSPETRSGSIWAGKGKGSTKITDSLWSSDY